MSVRSYAVVTGASKGIGRAIASGLAARGYDLLIVARSQQELDAARIELVGAFKVNVDTLALDLSDPEQVSRLYPYVTERKLPVSVLVNNAGYGLSGPFSESDAGEMRQMMELNTQTLVRLTREFLPMLIAAERGYILNVASTAAYQAVPYLAVYGATKAFVLSFSRALRRELRKTRMTVTCVSPGPTATNFEHRARVGPKALAASKKVAMQPDVVGKMAVDALFARKAEIITGGLNKAAAFFVWLLPKRFIENTAAKIYE